MPKNKNKRRSIFVDHQTWRMVLEAARRDGRPAACRGLVALPTTETYPAERRELLKNYPILREITK